MSTIAIQVKREKEMFQRGKDRAESQLARKLASGDLAETPAGINLCKQYVAPLAAAIQAFVDDAYKGKGGRRNAVAVLLKDVDAEVAAYMTVKAALKGATRRYALKTSGSELGRWLEAELVARAFEAAGPGLYKAVIKRAKDRGLSPSRQGHAVMNANKHFTVVPSPWTPDQRMRVGVKLIELLVDSLGLVETRAVKQRKLNRIILTHKPDILAWYTQYNEAACLTRPLTMPFVIPPKPWTDVDQGAYHGTEEGMPQRLLSRTFPGQLQALRAAGIPRVLAAVNRLQETPWRVSKRLLDLQRYAWDHGIELPGVPRRDDEPLPPSPQEVVDAAVGSQVRKDWRAKLRAVHERNAKNRSERFEFIRRLDMAAGFDGPIYFPCRLDFRGRVYTTSTSLNPQGADEVRGLLEFADGVPLGEDGLWWLGVHGANLYGNDKVSLHDRYQWAMDHVQEIKAAAQDPLSNRLWWTGADKPWQFLGWCFEWADAVDQGAAFVSHLPVGLDGSCNGIQHFSAMLRDEVGGRAVNLIPQDKPNDIYQRVADKALEHLQAIYDAGGEDAWMAGSWITWGVDRKLTKRSVMVVPYGGTFSSCMNYVGEAVKARIQAGSASPFGDELHKAVVFLAKAVWKAIGDVVISSRLVMSWLQACAKVAMAHGVDLRWTTPTGFQCVQGYRKTKGNRVKTLFQGSLVYFTSTQTTNELDRSKNVLSISPNFVHSLDASALMLTIEATEALGINSFLMIHDSYGTHAGNTTALAQALRKAFVTMYSENDVLQQFRDTLAARLPSDAELPPIPERGNLDLSVVLESDYFFA